MKKVVTVGEMRELEGRAGELGLPGPALMENAGRAVADELVRRSPRARRALVVVGPGNNGGDGLVAARHLHDAGVQVVLYRVNRPTTGDAKELLLRERDVPSLDLGDDPDGRLLDLAASEADLLIDAILGTGRSRPIAESLGTVLDRLNRRAAAQTAIAIDLPTGVNADTGAADPRAFRADLTLTLGFPKRGLLLGAAVDLVGELVVADIGIPAELAASLPVDFADAPSIAPRLPARTASSNKGTYGRGMIVAGSRQYTGAPVLCALGAERSGAGLVTLACPSSVRANLANHTLETTFLPLPDDDTGVLGPQSVEPLLARLDDYRAVLVGPGLGRSEATRTFLERLLPALSARNCPVVVDADALTMLAGLERFWERLPRSSMLTPHPGEMARLLGHPVPDDRIRVARESARSWGCALVLKGAYSVAAADGRATVLPFANPALATAGTGDVLAGIIVGMLAQGLETYDAALVGGFVHGVAGELVRAEVGPAGVLAGDVAARLPRALDAIRGGSARPPMVKLRTS